MSREVCGICWCPYDEDTGACACPPPNVQKITLRESAALALEALTIGCDAAYEVAQTYHASMAGYRPARHLAVDEDVRKIRSAIDALRAALAEPPTNPAPGYCKHCKQYTIEEPLPAEPVQEPDLFRCPQCGGPADNGHDRSIPPNPYFCTKCMEQDDMR